MVIYKRRPNSPKPALHGRCYPAGKIYDTDPAVQTEEKQRRNAEVLCGKRKSCDYYRRDFRGSADLAGEKTRKQLCTAKPLSFLRHPILSGLRQDLSQTDHKRQSLLDVCGKGRGQNKLSFHPLPGRTTGRYLYAAAAQTAG